MKLNFETKILIDDKNIHNLSKLDMFLRGMLRSHPDGSLEYLQKELSQNIYYIQKLKQRINEDKIEVD